MQAPQERPIVDVPPGQKAIEIRGEGELADVDAGRVVPESNLRPVVEDEVAQLCVGVQATQVSLAEFKRSAATTDTNIHIHTIRLPKLNSS